jgi:hypothetical protein
LYLPLGFAYRVLCRACPLVLIPEMAVSPKA